MLERSDVARAPLDLVAERCEQQVARLGDAAALGVPAIPGALTPTEVELAWSLGAAW